MRELPQFFQLPVSFAQQLRVGADIIERLTQYQGIASPPGIIEGLAINQLNRLADQLGADAWSPSAHSAVASVSKLAMPRTPG